LEDLQIAYDSGAEINLDDLNSFKRLETIGVPNYISFRLNPGKGHGQFKGIITGGKNSKFGIPKETIVEAYNVAKSSGVKKFGLQCHAGSSTLDAKTFSDITKQILKSAREIEDSLGQKLEKISIGSGFGIPYRDEEESLDLEQLFQNIKRTFEDFYGEDNSTCPTLCIEPGRILVADTGFILTRVTGLKSSYKEFVGLDAGMETLMRPALYGAFHRVQKIGHDDGDTITYDITGRICENTDRISEGYKMPAMKEGELCAIMDSGAYGYSMSHNFNTRPRPSEVLVDGEEVSLIRKRETIEDLFRGCDV
jgi:diaminopimelate decarboxylase